MYHVTGVDVSGKRFKIVTNNAVKAFGINLYRGSVWFVSEGKPRKLLKRVFN